MALFLPRLPRGPFLVRYASALGKGWKASDCDEVLTLEEARARANARRSIGFYSQIFERNGGVVVK